MKERLQLAWCAGLFDGEGCVFISRVPPTARNGLRNPSYHAGVKLTMGNRRSVVRFAKLIGVGTVHRHVEASDVLNGSTTWVALSRNAERALIKLRPHLITKAREADIALELLALPDAERGGAQGSPRIGRALLREKHRLYVKCSMAKSRFRFRKTPLPLFTHV